MLGSPFPGGKQTDRHCDTWENDGQTLRDRNQLVGSDPPYGGDTTYYWDFDSKSVAYIYFSSDGGHSKGTMVPAGDVLKFPDERYVGREGEILMRAEIRRTGPDQYHMKSEMIAKDGKVAPMLDTTYVRKPLGK